MVQPVFPRPAADEYAEYYGKYIAQVPEGNLLEILEAQLNQMMALYEGLSEAQGDFAYAPGKWTIREVILHITDAERVFAYRVLRIARGDTTALPGFDQNSFNAECGAGRRTVADLAAEFATVRRATQSLCQSLTAETAARRGSASGFPASARSIVWVIAGHAQHHLHLFKERYRVG